MTKSENHGIIIIIILLLLLLLCKKNSQYLYVIIEEHQKRIFHSLSLLKNVDGKSSYFSCYVLLYMTFIPLLFYTIFVFFFFFIYLYLKIFLCNNEKIYISFFGRKKKKDPIYGWMDGSVQQHLSSLQPSKLKRNLMLFTTVYFILLEYLIVIK